jgi:hypothetical protein
MRVVAVLVAALAIAGCEPRTDDCEPTDDTWIALQGSKLSPEIAQRLERRLWVLPRDQTTRIKLIGYWSMKRFDDDVAAAKHADHIVWFIEHRPQREIVGTPIAMIHDDKSAGYARALAAWDIVLARTAVDPGALWNAAAFFRWLDPARSRSALMRGERDAPEFAHWAIELGDLGTSEIAIGIGKHAPNDEIAAIARAALSDYKRGFAAAVADAEQPSELNFKDAAEVALLAGSLDEARHYADVALASVKGTDWPGWMVTHDAHIVRGKIAFARGDIDGAAAELAAAGKVIAPRAEPSPYTDLELAQALLDKGRPNDVIGYLAGFDAGGGRIAAWRAEIERGGKPLMRVWDDMTSIDSSVEDRRP